MRSEEVEALDRHSRTHAVAGEIRDVDAVALVATRISRCFLVALSGGVRRLKDTLVFVNY